MNHKLTAQDTRALRHADTLCFDHLADGTGRIRAMVDAEHSPTGFEQVHTVAAHFSRVQDYSDGMSADVYTGFCMIHSAKYSGTAHTLLRHLRVGGQFTFEWVRDNSSPVTRDAGLVRDEFRIRIAPASGKYVDVFLVEVRVGHDNSARMVKRA